MKAVQRRKSSRNLAALVSVVVLCAAVLVALAFVPASAMAFPWWAHDGIPSGSCVCHTSNATPTDAGCTTCHTGFQSPTGETCWSCHAPGEDTSTLSSTSAACSQTCHLWDEYTRAYDISFTHGTNPHLGSTPNCLDCHGTSSTASDPGQSPHHNASQQGFSDCTACHTGFAKHAGQVACLTCHPKAVAFHLYQATSPGFKSCSSCHSMKHAGKTVPQSKCAACHTGSGAGGGAQAQHSSTISEGHACGICHKQKLHAKALGSGITGCQTCHKGLYHAKQKLPTRTVCLTCHATARSHANGFQCTICHSSAIHNLRPTVAKIRPIVLGPSTK